MIGLYSHHNGVRTLVDEFDRDSEERRETPARGGVRDGGGREVAPHHRTNRVNDYNILPARGRYYARCSRKREMGGRTVSPGTEYSSDSTDVITDRRSSGSKTEEPTDRSSRSVASSSSSKRRHCGAHRSRPTTSTATHPVAPLDSTPYVERHSTVPNEAVESPLEHRSTRLWVGSEMRSASGGPIGAEQSRGAPTSRPPVVSKVSRETDRTDHQWIRGDQRNSEATTCDTSATGPSTERTHRRRCT